MEEGAALAAGGLVPDLGRNEHLMGLVRQLREAARHGPSGTNHFLVIDMLLGLPAGPPASAGRRRCPQILSRDRSNMANDVTVEQIDAWVREEHHKVMYRDEDYGDESKIN